MTESGLQKPDLCFTKIKVVVLPGKSTALTG